MQVHSVRRILGASRGQVNLVLGILEVCRLQA